MQRNSKKALKVRKMSFIAAFFKNEGQRKEGSAIKTTV